MSAAAELLSKIKSEASANWLPEIYQNQIRTLRTRAAKLDVPAKENKTEIQHTLLGVELKVGNVRISCPDLATARYLQVFARLGLPEAAIPYDITKISVLADELESAWQRLLLIIEHASDEQARTRIRSAIVKQLRLELTEIGAGEAIPQFNQNTKQRGK